MEKNKSKNYYIYLFREKLENLYNDDGILNREYQYLEVLNMM